MLTNLKEYQSVVSFAWKPIQQAISLLLLILVLSSAVPAYAQDDLPNTAIYIVQAGDNLWAIAARFGVRLSDLLAVNGLTENDGIFPGTELIIPNLPGVSGLLVDQEAGFGDSLSSLSRRFGVLPEDLARLNRIVSPNQLAPGRNLILTQSLIDTPEMVRTAVATGQSLL